MSRLSTVHGLPIEVRREVDRLLKLPMPQKEVAGWLRASGYGISKSAFNRYAKKLLDGSEDLKLLTTGGQPLGMAIAEVIADADPQLAELVADLVALQVRQLALLQKVQDRLRERHRREAARVWVKGQPE